MSRAQVVWVLAASLLALPLPGKAIAGPPEGASGRMAFDLVADGLRRYCKEADEGRRIKWLRKLASTKDPRVALVLGEAMMEGRTRLGVEVYATDLLYEWFLSDDDDFSEVIRSVRIWWKKNEAELRRRVKQLPR
jgi:hypothetical protein